MIQVFLLILILHHASSDQYKHEAEYYIRRGVHIKNESSITNTNISEGSTAFIVQPNPYILIQPMYINTDLNTDIKLFSLNENASDAATLIFEYNQHYLFKSMIFLAQRFGKFALLIQSNPYSQIGRFGFSFRTSCYVEMAAEDYPFFSSPNNYLRDSNLTHRISEGSQDSSNCTYKIYSRHKMPFTITFHYINYPSLYNLLVDSKRVIIGRRYFFNGNSSAKVILSYSGYINGSIGFNASVDVDLQLQFLPINEDISSGIPQISIFDKTFSLQYGSLTDLDAHVICLELGYGGLNFISDHKSLSNLSLLFHQFQCTGSENRLSQCLPVKREYVFNRYFHFLDSRLAVVNCSKKTLIQLINGTTKSTGIVQIKLGQEWGYFYGNIFFYSFGDILCKVLGFKKALEFNMSTFDFDYRKDIVISNVRCRSGNLFNNCNYQLWKPYVFCPKRRIGDCYYSSDKYPVHSNKVIHLICEDNNDFSLVPGHSSGFLKFKTRLVCYDLFAPKNAEVFCRAFGYPGVRKTVSKTSEKLKSQLRLNLRCTGTEFSPTDCSTDIYKNCLTNENVWISCQTVALIGGKTPNEGRVEVFFKGMRQYLCDDVYNMENGNVICKQLGFLYAQNLFKRSSNVQIDNLQCRGNEESIEMCSDGQWTHRLCPSDRISQLVCATNTSEYTLNTGSHCKEMNDSENNTIVGGVFTTTFKFHPWQASLLLTFNYQWCGATILNRNWLITAANCFKVLSNALYVRTGAPKTEWSSIEDSSSVFIHPFYSEQVGDHNIAIVKTKTSLQWSDTVQPVCLPSKNFSVNLTQCITTGWNYGTFLDERPLMEKHVIIKSTDTCIADTQFSRDQMKRYLCTDSDMDPAAIFDGDNGGPLICNYDGRRVLVGVLSRSMGGAPAASTQFYSRVDYFLDWIQSTINEN